MHFCDVCGMEAGLHAEDCYEPQCADIIRHWPPPCCPGCPCLSFEEAHGIVVEDLHDARL